MKTMITESGVLFYDTKVFGDSKEHEYDMKCFDGFALGTRTSSEDNAPAKILVKYPKLDEVRSSKNATSYILAYRGLGNDPTIIHYGDIMIAYGKICKTK